MRKKELYSTQNLYEATFCICKGIKLAGKKQLDKKIAILFDGENAQEQALEFYNGGKVEAKGYSDAYRMLKDYIFQR